MARDYARQRNPNGNNRGNGRGNNGRGGSGGNGGGSAASSIPGWVWLLMGLAIGLAVAAFVYIGQPSNKVTLGSAPAPAAAGVAATAAAAKDDGSGRKSSVPLPPKVPSRFGFYEMLPSYEVVIPHESSKQAASAGQMPRQPAAAPAVADPPDVKQALAEPGQYLIQVGAYRSREEADKNRASLALIGVESRIEQVTIDQKDTWYRVRIGPQATLAKAQEILERLEDNNIKGMLVKVKG
jgi:cell division septation protein DedD